MKTAKIASVRHYYFANFTSMNLVSVRAMNDAPLGYERVTSADAAKLAGKNATKLRSVYDRVTVKIEA